MLYWKPWWIKHVINVAYKQYKIGCRFGFHQKSQYFKECLNPYCNKKL